MTARVALVTCAALPHLCEDDLLLVPALTALGLAEFRAWLQARVAARALLCNSADVAGAAVRS